MRTVVMSRADRMARLPTVAGAAPELHAGAHRIPVSTTTFACRGHLGRGQSSIAPATGVGLSLCHAACYTRIMERPRIVVLTGAGMSAESGIATFRDALTGLWPRFDPAELACEKGFRRDPALVWGWYRWRAAQLMGCEPNAGHRGLAMLADAGHDLHIVTQNVDDLHERAGSPDVLHLHGQLLRSRCIDCGAMREPEPMLQSLGQVTAEGTREPPPRCEVCGGDYRPGVVWFGEALPEAAWRDAAALAGACELMVVIGTSSLVQPAASLPLLAKRNGARIIEINPQAAPLSASADEHWACGAAEGVARLRDLLRH